MNSPFNRVPGTRFPLPSTMTCPVCGTIHKVRGYFRHLKSCLPQRGLDFAAYERQYRLISYSPGHAFAIQVLGLMDVSVTHFGLGGYHGCEWFHVNSSISHRYYYTTIPGKDGHSERQFRRPETRPLLAYRDGQLDLQRSFYQFREHLRGDLTLAIWPNLDNRFLMIDLDGRQTQHLAVLLKRLDARGLPYHLEFSGSKGYHVWVFFRRVVPNALLIALYNELCEGLETDRNVWPFRKGLIKLFLGLHAQTRNFAGFLKGPTIPIPLEQQLDYFLSIKPVQFPKDISIEWKTPLAPVCRDNSARRARPRKAGGRTIPEWLSNEECAELLQNNARPNGLSRYYLLFGLATYLKEIGRRTEKECRDVLLAWSRCVSKSGDHELARDAERQVRNVFALRVHRAGGEMPELVTQQKVWLGTHVDQVLRDYVAPGHRLDRNQLPQAREALRRLAEYLVQLVLWREARAYASFKSIAKRTGLSIKRITKWLPILCGDTEDIAPMDGPSRYRGQLLLRVSLSSRDQGLAQEYVLTALAENALLPKRDSAA